MKTETIDKVKALREQAKQLFNDIYEYDYDKEALWALDEAIRQLNNIVLYA